MGALAGRRRGRLLPLVVALLALPMAVGWHWAKLGWVDQHIGYPYVPSGYTQIVNRFGQPCNANASFNHMTVVMAGGQVNTIAFHKKLGGMATAMVTGQGGTSTNLDNDVFGHIHNQHLDPYIKYGTYGYNCRYKRNGSEWSTHAWGIAVDVSTLDEPSGQCYSTVNKYHAQIWKNHGWTWGASWCDPMHFQYATNY